MALLSASSSISSLVMQLQHIESTIAGILLEVVLKLSSLTDSDIFLVVEDAGRRSWMGRRRFREAFLDGSLAATPVDVEWCLEGDRIVRRQGIVDDLRGLDAEEPDAGLEDAMTSFVSPSKKPVNLARTADGGEKGPSSSHLFISLYLSDSPSNPLYIWDTEFSLSGIYPFHLTQQRLSRTGHGCLFPNSFRRSSRLLSKSHSQRDYSFSSCRAAGHAQIRADFRFRPSTASFARLVRFPAETPLFAKPTRQTGERQFASLSRRRGCERRAIVRF